MVRLNQAKLDAQHEKLQFPMDAYGDIEEDFNLSGALLRQGQSVSFSTPKQIELAL